MSKVSNNSSPIKKDTKTTEKGFFLKWHPTVRKVIGYVVFAVFSMLSNNQSPQVVINVSIKIIKEVPAQIEEVIQQVPNLPLDVVNDRLKDNDWIHIPDGQSFWVEKMDKKQCDSD